MTSVAQYASPYGYNNNFSSAAHIGDLDDYNRFIWASHRRGENVYDYGALVSPRESRHIVCDYTHTLDGQLSQACYDDSIALCYSNHDPKGRVSSLTVEFGLLPPNLYMEFSFSSMLPKGLDGIIVTGKAFSAEHDALPAMRMQADLHHIGGAVGIAAALCCKNGTTLRELGGAAVRLELVKNGWLPEKRLHPDMSLSEAVKRLTPEDAFNWLEMPMDGHLYPPTPAMLLMSASDEDALAVLEAEWAKRKFLKLAILLARHASAAGADVICEAIDKELAETDGLPSRKASCRIANMPPDHGVMSEITYLIHALSYVGDPRAVGYCGEIVSRLERSERNWEQPRKGVWYHAESVAYAAENTLDIAYLPLLKRISALPELRHPIARNKSEAVDIVKERWDYLAMLVMRARYMLKDEQAKAYFIELQNDVRALFAKEAQRVLAGI